MANNLLKIDVNEYKNQVGLLETLLGQLDGKITQFQTKERELDKFITDADRNYDSIKKTISVHISTCKNYKTLVEENIKTLNKILDNIQEFGTTAEQAFENAYTSAKSMIETALEAVASSLD